MRSRSSRTNINIAERRWKASAVDDLIEQFVGRYPNVKTAQQYESEFTSLFAFAGVTHPKALTEAAVNQWVGQAGANNTRRGRLARACAFLRWCVRRGEAAPELVEALQGRENPLRTSTPAIYGKVQGKYPARWLTHAEAYETLLGVCDDSDVGRRDAPIFRLGLAGMRVSEILRLEVGSLQRGGDPLIQWIGKRNRPRKVAIGPARLLALLDDYLGRYERAMARPLAVTDPLVCRQENAPL